LHAAVAAGWRRKLRAGYCMTLELEWAEGAATAPRGPSPRGSCSGLEVMDTDDADDLELPGSAPPVVRAALAAALESLKEEMVAQQQQQQ
jgi:hypothetical protein